MNQRNGALDLIVENGFKKVLKTKFSVSVGFSFVLIVLMSGMRERHVMKL